MIFATWLTFGADNQPTWYSLQPGRWTANSIFSGPVYVTRGPGAGGNGSTAGVETRQVGTGTLSFADSAHGTFEYTLSGASGVKAIARMSF